MATGVEKGTVALSHFYTPLKDNDKDFELNSVSDR
jgi:hypothetical protein